MNPKEDRALKAQLDEYTRNGWIEPAHSAYGAGVLFAKSTPAPNAEWAGSIQPLRVHSSNWGLWAFSSAGFIR